MSTATSSFPDLRPLALGELVDRTVTFWRRQLGPLFRLYLGYQLWVYALMKLYTWIGSYYFPLLRGRQLDILQASGPELFGQVALALGAGVIVFLLLFWGSWLAGVAGTHFTVGRLLGQPGALEDGIRRSWHRLGTTTVTFLLSLLWGLGVSVLCTLPGAALAALGVWLSGPWVALTILGAVLLGLGFLVTLLWYTLRFLLTSQVLAMEDVGPREAFRRSGRLVSGRIGGGFTGLVAVRATVLLTAVMFLLFSVNLLSSVPALIVQAVYGRIFDPERADPNAIPQLLLVPAELFQVGVVSVFSPIFVVFAAAFYVDMRMRREGLDLELKLRALSAARAPGEGG